MDGVSAVSGLLGLAGLAALVLQTAAQLRGLCHDYAEAQGDIDRVSNALQTLQGLLEETVRLCNDETVVNASTLFTRSG